MIAPSLMLATILAGAPGLGELELAGGETQLRIERPTLHGLPLRGAYEVQAKSPGAGERSLAARGTREAPNALPHQCSLVADQALELAARRFEWPTSVPLAEPRLVYLLLLGRPILAWELDSPTRFGASPLRERVWLSATSGRILARRPLAFDSKALVFREDPASTPAPVLVELSTLALGLADEPLSSPAIDVRGCVDASDEEPPPWWSEGQCVPWARARSDEAGDFLLPLPNVGLAADNEAFDDPYAELAAYYHVETFLAGMAARGLTSTRCERFTVNVNRYAITNEGERVPQGGASFIDECDADLTPTLVIGQGRYVDYAYDADIVFHEMGHSVIQMLAPEGLSDRRYAPSGILSEAGAINEGVADYWAMTLADDPEVGEYVGRFSVEQTSPFLRTGQNTKTCPRDLVGQWHGDGLIVSGALWSARERIGLVLDEILLQALPRLAPDATLEEFGQAMMSSAGDFVEAGAIGELERELLERTLAGRGLLDCPHVIDDFDLATGGKRMILIPKDETLAPFAPGPLQLRYEVPEGEREVTVFFTMILTSGEPPAQASILIGKSGEAIEFEYELVDEQLTVSGDWDVELEAESLNGQDFIARVEVEPGEVLHVALANRSAGGASVSNFFVVASDAQELDVPAGGCGCVAGGRGDPPPWGGGWLGLVLLGLVRRRGDEWSAARPDPS